MGPDLGKVVLMVRRALMVAVALAASLACPGVAFADDVGPPAPGQPVPAVSPPSQQQIQDARDAMERLRHPAGSTATPGTLSRVAGPLTGSGGGQVAARITDREWWTIGAGALVLLVASETTRIGGRAARHRKST